MNLKGNQTYNASAQEIWDILMDVDKLAKITPGVSKLVSIGEDQYNAISEIKIGPVKGAFQGDLFLEEKIEPASFTLRVKQQSKIGNADATVAINLNEASANETELSFDGKAKLSGTLARTGQRVLGGVANTLTKQFFKALGEEIDANKSSNEVATPEKVVYVETVEQEINATEDAGIIEEALANVDTTVRSQEKESTEVGFFTWLKNLFSGK